ncbi:predicted protein [Histoplasma capsulatum G186AR]|uniref:Uncharacterized protein n=1 Tax=Ajellomyces capsulatus (strain G186AR / H82 / ATCC MYA-2454 / RMSCC 2432) TaxID=447093 RepID=C0NKL3_AJECG|nr:uncharacterized protein HCBG_03693 [Histoplasma capsulatum G186AR]EEH08404.1 predicted protein [Histoplasma capsulatum G186AR]
MSMPPAHRLLSQPITELPGPRQGKLVSFALNCQALAKGRKVGWNQLGDQAGRLVEVINHHARQHVKIRSVVGFIRRCIFLLKSSRLSQHQDKTEKNSERKRKEKKRKEIRTLRPQPEEQNQVITVITAQWLEWTFFCFPSFNVSVGGKYGVLLRKRKTKLTSYYELVESRVA